MAGPPAAELLELLDRTARGEARPAEVARLRRGITDLAAAARTRRPAAPDGDVTALRAQLAAQRRVLIRLRSMAEAWKRRLPRAVDRDAVADAVLLTLEPALPAPATEEGR